MCSGFYRDNTISVQLIFTGQQAPALVDLSGAP